MRDKSNKRSRDNNERGQIMRCRGSASAQICEPSRRDSGRLPHSRGPTELIDLSPTERNWNYGVTIIPWPSADLIEQECTCTLSKSKSIMGIDRSGI